MNNKDFNLRDPLNAYMTIILLLVLGGGYYFWTSIYSELDEQSKTLTAEKETKEQKLADVKRKVAQLPEFEKKLAISEAQLEELKLMFPDEESVPYRLQDLYKAIRKSGVKINKFEPAAVPVATAAPTAPPPPAAPAQPGAPSDDPKQYYQENFYQIQLDGGYHMFGEIFAELANFQYPTKISGLKVNPFAGIRDQMEKAKLHGLVPVTMSIEFQLTTYSSRK